MARDNNDRKKGLFSKLFSPAGMIVTNIIDNIVYELKRRSKNLITVIIQLVMGFFFFGIFWGLLNYLCVLALQKVIDDLFICVLIVTGVNLLLSIIFFAAAKSKYDNEI